MRARKTDSSDGGRYDRLRGTILESHDMLSNWKEIHVEWGDCDPAGIVYYPRFFEYFDACTNALFERAGFRKAEMLKTYGLLGIPMIDTRAQFYLAASFGDTVAIETRVVEWGRSSF